MFWRQTEQKSKHYYSDDLEENDVTSLISCRPFLIISNNWDYNNFVELIFVRSITFDKTFEWNPDTFFAYVVYIVHIMVLCCLNTGAVRDAFMAPWPPLWNKAAAVAADPLKNTQQPGQSPLRWRGFRYLGIPLAM